MFPFCSKGRKPARVWRLAGNKHHRTTAGKMLKYVCFFILGEKQTIMIGTAVFYSLIRGFSSSRNRGFFPFTAKQ